MGFSSVTLAPGVEIIRTSFGDRPLNMTLVHERELALVDTGLVGTPAESVIPFLGTIGHTPRDLGLVIVTHAHADHFGGNEELWSASDQTAKFAAHRLDQAFIEDPPSSTRQLCQSYVELGLMAAEEVEDGIRASGNGVRLDHVLEGGEVFPLGGGLELEIIHLPGHTAGNVAVLERKHKLLIQGESILGTAQYSVQGELLTCPQHEGIVPYLKTIEAVARTDFQTLIPSHLSLMDRSEAARFLEDSLDFVLRFETEIRDRLRATGQAVTALELWRSLGKLWGLYPNDLGLFMLLETHLRGLVQRRLAKGSPTGGIRWLGGDEDGLAPLVRRARLAIQAM